MFFVLKNSKDEKSKEQEQNHQQYKRLSSPDNYNYGNYGYDENQDYQNNGFMESNHIFEKAISPETNQHSTATQPTNLPATSSIPPTGRSTPAKIFENLTKNSSEQKPVDTEVKKLISSKREKHKNIRPISGKSRPNSAVSRKSIPSRKDSLLSRHGGLSADYETLYGKANDDELDTLLAASKNNILPVTLSNDSRGSEKKEDIIDRTTEVARKENTVIETDIVNKDSQKIYKKTPSQGSIKIFSAPLPPLIPPSRSSSQTKLQKRPKSDLNSSPVIPPIGEYPKEIQTTSVQEDNTKHTTDSITNNTRTESSCSAISNGLSTSSYYSEEFADESDDELKQVMKYHHKTIYDPLGSLPEIEKQRLHSTQKLKLDTKNTMVELEPIGGTNERRNNSLPTLPKQSDRNSYNEIKSSSSHIKSVVSLQDEDNVVSEVGKNIDFLSFFENTGDEFKNSNAIENEQKSSSSSLGDSIFNLKANYNEENKASNNDGVNNEHDTKESIEEESVKNSKKHTTNYNESEKDKHKIGAQNYGFVNDDIQDTSTSRQSNHKQDEEEKSKKKDLFDDFNDVNRSLSASTMPAKEHNEVNNTIPTVSSSNNTEGENEAESTAEDCNQNKTSKSDSVINIKSDENVETILDVSDNDKIEGSNNDDDEKTKENNDMENNEKEQIENSDNKEDTDTLFENMNNLEHNFETPRELRGSSLAGSLFSRASNERVVRKKTKWHPPWQLKQEVVAAEMSCSVTELVIDPTNRWFATGSNDMIIKLWDIDTGRLKLNIKEHKQAVRAMAFGPVGHRHLYSTGDDRQVLCHDVEVNRVISNIKANAVMYDLSIYEPSNLLVCGGRDKLLKVYDIRTAKLVRSLRGHQNTVSCLVTNDFTGQIVSGSHDGTIRVWDIKEGKCMELLHGHQKSVRMLTQHPEENLVLSTSSERILGWDLPTANRTQEIIAEKIAISTVTVNHLGVVAGGGSNGGIHLWDYKSGELFQKISRSKVYGSQEIPICVFATKFDHSGTKLLCADASNVIKIYKEAYTKGREKIDFKQRRDTRASIMVQTQR